MQRRLEDIGLACRRTADGNIDNEMHLAAVAMHESAKFCGHEPVDGYVVTGRWKGLMGLGLEPQALAEARQLAAWCSTEADRLERQAAADRSRSYREWAKKATANGGGAAHAWTKIPTGWKEAVAAGGAHPNRKGLGPNGVTSEPQKVVTAELSKWVGTWAASSEPADALPPWPGMERLVPALDHEIRKVSLTFKWRTGLGLDQLHPRHLAMVTDGCLYVLGYLFFRAETHGSWADPMCFFSFFMLSKPTGGFRTIGLLNSLYRIWARLRMPLVRDWAAKVPRRYFAAGVGKSTEDAIGRLLLTAEAAGEDEEVACVREDIDKCYENVKREKVIAAAIRHNFPLAILRLCLAMYRAARAIAWNGAYSAFVHSGQTVVPGCSIALWLVQLLMITPLDEMISNLPRQISNLEVYVDDVAIQIRGQVGKVGAAAIKAGSGLVQGFPRRLWPPCLQNQRQGGSVVDATGTLGGERAKEARRHSSTGDRNPWR